MEAFDRINKIDAATVTIDDLYNLINPVLDGFRVLAKQFEPGVYLYRTRKCNKPININEVSYPPVAYSKIGRANEEGQPVFYASVGKNVPFFELNPSIGDTIAVSYWKTKSTMLLNTVGYTADALDGLGSKRGVETVFPANIIKSVGEENELINHFLASCFTAKIHISESEKYELSAAITRILLSGDIFSGIMYPTVKMFGNADNVALTRDFADKNLELLAIEFVEVTE